MIVIGLFLHPVMMVLGLMASMFLAYVMFAFVNETFLIAMGTVLSGDFVGPIVYLFQIFIYVSIVLVIVHSVYGLIIVHPQQHYELARWWRTTAWRPW